MSARGGTRIVGFFIKGTRPSDPNRAWGLQRLAYQAFKSLNIDAKEVLVRGDIHNTTTINGRTGIDPRGYHLTLSIRSEDNIKNNTFISAHAYTSGRNDFDLKNATLAAQPLPLTAKGRANKPIWPANIAQEDVFYVDPTTGPEPEPQGHATGSGGHATGSTGAHSTGQAPSTAGGNVPSAGGHTPSTAGHTPSTAGHAPSTSGHAPSTAGHAPSTAGHAPSTGAHSTGHTAPPPAKSTSGK